MTRFWRSLAPIAAAAVGIIVWTAPAEAQTRVTQVAAQRDPDSFGGLERLAVLQTDDKGAQTLVLRLVYTFQGKDTQVGDRAGSDAVLDLAGIWGNGNLGFAASGRFVDVMLSSVAKPESILLLHESGGIVEMRGIWGNGNLGIWGNGNLGIWGNGNIGLVAHGPFFDTAACGKATTFAEGVREFQDPLVGFQDPLVGYQDPLVGFQDPLVGIGTEGGCVGFAGLEVQDSWYGAPGSATREDWEDAKLVATGGPLVKVANARIDDLSLIPVVEDWIPIPDEWVPSPDDWFEFAALADGQVYGVYPGRRSTPSSLGAPPFSTFKLDASSLGQKLTSLAASRFESTSNPPALAIPGGGSLLDWPLVGANRTGSVQLAALEAGLQPGAFTPLALKGSVQLCSACTIKAVELGSLVAVTDDGQVLFAPDFNPVDGSGASGIVSLGALMSVDMGPSTLNLKSLGSGLTAVIESTGDDVLGIDPATIRLNVIEDALDPLAPEKVTTADKDRDGHDELVVKFDRTGIVERLSAVPGNAATLELTWSYVEVCDVDEEGNDVPCAGGYSKVVKVVK